MTHNLSFDGRRLSTDVTPGRSFRVDARCLAGPGVAGWANVCASTADVAVPFDDPAVQAARRDALAWWIGLLGDELICLTTLALDASRCAGAITVARSTRHFADDPFARLFAPTAIRTDLLARVAPPPGPVTERYGAAPWPADGFASA